MNFCILFDDNQFYNILNYNKNFETFLDNFDEYKESLLEYILKFDNEKIDLNDVSDFYKYMENNKVYQLIIIDENQIYYSKKLIN
jgi:hypothetical protein